MLMISPANPTKTTYSEFASSSLVPLVSYSGQLLDGLDGYREAHSEEEAPVGESGNYFRTLPSERHI